MNKQEITSKYQEIIKDCKSELKKGNVQELHNQIPELSWMIFLKYLDDLDERFSFNKNYKPLLPEHLRWRNWTGDKKETGKKFEDKVTLIFRELGDLQPTVEKRFFSVISSIFRNLPRRVTDGIRLRILVNKIDQLSFKRTDEVAIFEEIYQKELFEMVKSAGKSAYYYTPRALAKLLVTLTKPKLESEEKIFDPACGFGGFLIESLLSMRDVDLDLESRNKLFYSTISGIEKDSTTFLCATLNCMLNGLAQPNIRNTNTMSLDTNKISNDSKYDVIITNPTHGGDEDHSLSRNLPPSFVTTDTSLHFLYFVTESLKENGRAAMIVTNGFLFGDDKTTNEYKKRLLSEFNLHTIIRLSGSIFEPYNGVEMNIILFDKSNQSEDISYYRFKIPERVKGTKAKTARYGKTSPPIYDDFSDLVKWYETKKENPNVYSHKKSKLIETDSDGNITKIDLDKKHPDDEEEVIDLSPHELIDTILKDEEKTLELLRDVKELIKKEIPK